MKTFTIPIIFVLLAAFFIISGCTPATTSSITGVWQVTHALGIPQTGGIYYEYRSDGTVSRDSNKSDLFTSNASDTGTYTLDSSGNLKISFISSYTYTVYILGNYLYMYYSGMEAVRLEKR